MKRTTMLGMALCALAGAAAAGDPFAPYLAPFRDGAVLRLPNPHAPAPSE